VTRERWIILAGLALQLSSLFVLKITYDREIAYLRGERDFWKGIQVQWEAAWNAEVKVHARDRLALEACEARRP